MLALAVVLVVLAALVSTTSAFHIRLGVGWNNRMTTKLLRPIDILNPTNRVPMTSPKLSILPSGILKLRPLEKTALHAVQGNEESEHHYIEQPTVWHNIYAKDDDSTVITSTSERAHGAASSLKQSNDVVTAETPAWKKPTAQSIASKAKLELLVQPSKRIVQLEYDFKSTSSIFTIKHKWWRKKLPAVPAAITSHDKQKIDQTTGSKSSAQSTENAGDAYLVDWWLSARKWGLLTEKVLKMVRRHQPVQEIREESHEINLSTETCQTVSKSEYVGAKELNRMSNSVSTSNAESGAISEHNGSTECGSEQVSIAADIHDAHIKHTKDVETTSVRSTATSQRSIMNEKQHLFAPVSVLHVEPVMSTAMKEKVAAASALAAKKRQKQHNSARGNKLYKQKRRLLQKAQQKALQQKALLARQGQQQTADLSVAFPVDSTSCASSVTLTEPVPEVVPESFSVCEGGANTLLPNQKGNKKNEKKEVPLAALQALCRTHQARVIAIGDVHGCADELCDLLREIVYLPGDQIVLLGDLVAKGPKSVDVVRMAMDLGAISVRGNHDHELVRKYYSTVMVDADKSSPASEAADNARRVYQVDDVIHQPGLEDVNSNANCNDKSDKSIDSEWHRKLSKHAKIAHLMSPEELAWIGDLPYIIQSQDLNALFVHAGLQKNVSLDDQQPTTVMNMCSELTSGRVSIASLKNFAWAPLWEGPQTVYFGHDTSRGLQQCLWAYGLDTGCVYGGNLTAILLPERKIVSVPARKAYVKLQGRN
eukprot:gene13652-15704_t